MEKRSSVTGINVSLRRPLPTSVTNISFENLYCAKQESAVHRNVHRSFEKQGSTSSRKSTARPFEAIDEMSDTYLEHFDARNGVLVRSDPIARNRITEEIMRIQQRQAVVSDREKNDLIEKALSMNTPKLAREMTEERRVVLEEGLRENGSFLSCYTGDVHSDLDDEHFVRSVEEVEKLRQRMLTRASVVSIDKHVPTKVEEMSSSSTITSSVTDKGDEVSNFIDELIGSDGSRSKRRQRIGSGKLSAAKSALREVSDDNFWPKNGGTSPKSASADYDTDLFVFDNDDEFADEQMTSPTTVSPGRRSVGLLQSSFSMIRSSRDSQQSNGDTFLKRADSSQRVSLEDVLFDVLEHSPTQQPNDLKAMLTSLKGRMNMRRDRDIPEGCKKTEERDTLLHSPIEAKYNLKQSDNQLLALATAVEAGDVAGRMLADMMVAKNRGGVVASIAAGAHYRRSRGTSRK